MIRLSEKHNQTDYVIYGLIRQYRKNPTIYQQNISKVIFLFGGRGHCTGYLSYLGTFIDIWLVGSKLLVSILSYQWYNLQKGKFCLSSLGMYINCSTTVLSLKFPKFLLEKFLYISVCLFVTCSTYMSAIRDRRLILLMMILLNCNKRLCLL